MIMRKLLATTALVAAVTTGAYAAETVTDPTAAAPGATVNTLVSGESLASNVIGATVYNSAADSGETLGEVNDLVLAANGDVESAIIDVGGFLGIGEKSVAIPFDSLKWQADANGNNVLVLATTKEQLEALPSFEAADKAAAVDTTTRPVDVAATPMAPATDTPATDMASPAADSTAVAVTPANEPVATTAVTAVSADQLINTTVYGTDDANIGEVGDVILAKDGTIDAVVLDVGGFLGMGEKPVAIAYKDLQIGKDANNNLILKTAFTRDQLDAAPTYDEAAFQNSRDQMLVRSSG